MVKELGSLGWRSWFKLRGKGYFFLGNPCGHWDSQAAQKKVREGGLAKGGWLSSLKHEGWDVVAEALPNVSSSNAELVLWEADTWCNCLVN